MKCNLMVGKLIMGFEKERNNIVNIWFSDFCQNQIRSKILIYNGF